MMYASIQRGLSQAFYEGMKLGGINPEEMTADEILVLDTIIATESSFVANLADDIVSGRESPLKNFSNRVSVWAERWSEVKSRAQVMADKDGKFVWVLNPICQHCDDCLSLAGKVKRGSTWDDSGIYPRSSKLLCNIGCKCELEKTTEPLSRGPLPRM